MRGRANPGQSGSCRVFGEGESGSLFSCQAAVPLQPAVTQAVKRLEEQLGVTLFTGRRGTRLTPEGSVLFHYVDQYGFIETGSVNQRDEVDVVGRHHYCRR